MNLPGGEEQPFIAHLLELRTRLLRCILAVALVEVVLLPFSNKIYTFVARPLLSHLPKGTAMIATEVASPFLVPFKLTLIVAIVLAVPVILYQIWAFVAPGLYQNERRIVLPLLTSSTLLFYLGMAFAYFVVFPLMFKFFTSTAPEGVAVMTDIGKYLDFVFVVFLAFGIAFEVPVATVLLVWVGITTPESLAAKRPYIIVAAFVIGALLTPPDVISQTLLAVPMWLLFELGLVFSRLLLRQLARAPDRTASDAGGATPTAASAAAYRGGEFELDEELQKAEAEERRLGGRHLDDRSHRRESGLDPGTGAEGGLEGPDGKPRDDL
jgi:sec-independent protein translocase protein TatC